MRAEPSSIRNSFFKDIIIKKTCKITPLVLVSKPEIAAVEKIFKVTNAKDFLQNKLHSKSKYKPIFETSIKSANKNPFIHAQTRRNSLPYAPHRIAKVQNPQTSKMNQLIFKTEVDEFIKKKDLQSVIKKSEGKSCYIAKYNVTNLRRSFKLSDHCKSSLLELNHLTRPKKWQSFCTSISYSSDYQPIKTYKRERTLRSMLKPKNRSNERLASNREELRGWEQTAVRFYTNYETIDLND